LSDPSNKKKNHREKEKKKNLRQPHAYAADPLNHSFVDLSDYVSYTVRAARDPPRSPSYPPVRVRRSGGFTVNVSHSDPLTLLPPTQPAIFDDAAEHAGHRNHALLRMAFVCSIQPRRAAACFVTTRSFGRGGQAQRQTLAFAHPLSRSDDRRSIRRGPRNTGPLNLLCSTRYRQSLAAQASTCK
jgi:hypothetical protein